MAKKFSLTFENAGLSVTLSVGGKMTVGVAGASAARSAKSVFEGVNLRDALTLCDLSMSAESPRAALDAWCAMPPSDAPAASEVSADADDDDADDDDADDDDADDDDAPAPKASGRRR